MKRFILAALAAVALITADAAAAPVLKFDDPVSPGGTVAHSGVIGDPITGTAIQFQTIQGIDTPLNAGVTLTCVGCLLNFTTGGVTTEGPTVWTAAGGGSLTITGAVPGLGLGAGTLLAEGDFSDSPSTTVVASGTSGTFFGFGEDTKNETLASFFGLGPDFVFLSTEIALTTTRIGASGGFANPGQFEATPNNSDFNNASVVPLPSALMLLGSGLLGVAAIARRRSA